MRRSSSLAGFSQTSNSKQMKRNFSVAVGKEKQKDSTMKSSLKTALVVVTLALPFPAASLADALTITGYPTSVTVSIIQSVESSQQKVTAGEQLKSQLVGAWTLVLMDGVKADGTRQPRFGPNPIGSLIFTPNGRFSVQVMRSNRPLFASNNRDTGTAEENKAAVQGTLCLFGTYTVDEVNRSFALLVEGSSYPNFEGRTQRLRSATVTDDVLTFNLPGENSSVPGSGFTAVENIWKKVK
jgi:hypothetical protein